MNSHTESDEVVSTAVTVNPNNSVVRLEGASVRYRIPVDRISSFKEFTIRKLQRKIRYHEVWALNDINLEILKGEVFGVIGKNGAGKSTCLKLIAQVLRPALGRVLVRGKVAPLLELGAGFHPELTGRENLFLNGALLGFSRKDMSARFEGIVDFAELWDFIDLPLRTYSSGMVTRLGFSIATASDCDVLLVDEYLTVGDEDFQRKSSERLNEFIKNGATTILVTHDMDTVVRMCRRVAWLDRGKLQSVGDPEAVIQQYHASIR